MLYYYSIYYIDKVIRVLKPGGIFLYITWGQPHFRKRLLERKEWDVSVVTIDDGVGFGYFMYVCRLKV